jgi:son of sevenless
MSIISALNSTPIHRLKRTWEMVPSKTMQTFDELNKVMHSTMNFTIYREKIHTVSLPCLPFLGTPYPSFMTNSLGVYLSDLTFIEDGNPNMLRNNEKLINFSKRMKTTEVIRDLQQYQTVPYPFQRVNDLQIWLDNELSNSSEIQELYHLSTQVEPREREDEKM